MTPKATDKRPSRRPLQALAFLAVCTCVTAFAVAGASAGSGPKPAGVIGQTNHTPAPLCPQKPSENFINNFVDHHPGQPPPAIKHGCQVVGSVTGFQLKADGHHNAFRAPNNARIVAWAVSVANPNRYEEKAFGSTDFFGTNKLGGHPTAQLAILKKKDGPTFKLLRRSPVVDLDDAQGHKQYITLDNPMKVKKGQVVGMTFQTWAPILAYNKKVAAANSWKASRKQGKCDDSNPDRARQLAINAKPQTKIHSTREYGCTYTGRLLYWAYYVRGLGH